MDLEGRQITADEVARRIDRARVFSRSRRMAARFFTFHSMVALAFLL